MGNSGSCLRSSTARTRRRPKPAQQAFANVQSSAADLAKNWEEAKSKDIAALNEQLRDAKLPAINVAAVISPGDEAEGEDQP